MARQSHVCAGCRLLPMPCCAALPPAIAASVVREGVLRVLVVL